MPFKSEAQRRFMHKFHPDVADRWEREKKKRKGHVKEAEDRKKKRKKS